ncbi:hypothetical protein B296_00005652 [Ensete ventricosum]|uniref:Uncharacterized protein n=1 Tax=Ensete ventricosum TaxID=4639 RepID=A0A426YCP3_ENSVE|nr:hypothetical protein B296_00005652 [Ensete ventricosum]
MVPQRQVFRVYVSKLASDESLGRQHMGAVYHRGSSQIASTSESHGGDLIILRYNWSNWRVGLLQCSYSLKGAGKSEDKAEDGTSVKSSIPCSQGGRALVIKGAKEVCNGKLQVPRQGERAEAKELHKTSVDGLLIKIAESEGLWVDVGVLDQGTK